MTGGYFVRQFVEFRVGKEYFCIDIDRVRYIERFRDVTHVPNVPKYIEGIINIHGEVVAVYNLHQKFNLNQPSITDSTVFIIVSVGNIGIALIVDSVSQIVSNQKYPQQTTPKMILGKSKYIPEVLKSDEKIILTLDIDEIIDSQERQDISAMLNSQKEEAELSDSIN